MSGGIVIAKNAKIEEDAVDPMNDLAKYSRCLLLLLLLILLLQWINDDEKKSHSLATQTNHFRDGRASEDTKITPLAASGKGTWPPGNQKDQRVKLSVSRIRSGPLRSGEDQDRLSQSLTNATSSGAKCL